MDEVTETARVEPDTRLVPHLDAGERVLWQGWPEARGLLPVGTLVALALFAVPAIFVPIVLLTSEGAADGGAALALLFPVAFAAVPVLAVWFKRKEAREVVYAVTDRRLLDVRGARLRRAEGVERVEEVRVARRGRAHGDVYWRTERRRTGSGSKRRTVRVLIGFAGIPEPEPVARFLDAWRQERLSEAATRAAEFAAAVASGGIEELAAAGGAQTISSLKGGFALSVPAGWTAEVARNAVVGPMLVEGGFRPYSPGDGDWNSLRLSGAGGAQIHVTRQNGPIPRTFEEVRDDRFAQLLNVPLISADPEVRIGPWRGFAVAHTLQDAGLLGMRLFGADLLQRQVWLDLGDAHLYVRMAAPGAAHDAQRALDAVVQTLRPC
jgi:hypothetical protein